MVRRRHAQRQLNHDIVHVWSRNTAEIDFQLKYLQGWFELPKHKQTIWQLVRPVRFSSLALHVQAIAGPIGSISSKR